MTFITTQPQIVAAAAAQLAGIGSELTAPNAAAMGRWCLRGPRSGKDAADIKEHNMFRSRRDMPRRTSRGQKTQTAGNNMSSTDSAVSSSWA